MSTPTTEYETKYRMLHEDYILCEDCGGDGKLSYLTADLDSNLEICDRCEGTGWMLRPDPADAGDNYAKEG